MTPTKKPIAEHPLWQELWLLLPLAGPIIASQLGQIGMMMADTLMVGPLGAEALAAVGLGGAIHMFFLVLCSGVVISVSPLVSQAFGAGDTERCRRVLAQGLLLTIVASIPVAATAFAGHSIALALGQPAAVAALSGEYMWAIAWGCLPQLAFMAVRQYLEGLNQVRAPMLITFGGLAINVVANFLLIYGVPGWIPAMGAVGTGWATSIVRWAMCAAALAYLWRRLSPRPLRLADLRPDRLILGELVRLGIPIGIQTGLELGLFSFAAVMMGWIGSHALAAHQVTINIASTTFMVALGMGLAGSIRVGQHVGARAIERIRHATVATYLLAIGFMGLCALLFVSVPESLVRLYTPDETVIALGAQLLLMAALFQVFDGAQVAGISILRGAGDTRGPMILGAVGYWLVGVPTGYYLAFHTSMGAVGIWAGLCFGLAVVSMLLGWRVRQFLKRTAAVGRQPSAIG